MQLVIDLAWLGMDWHCNAHFAVSIHTSTVLMKARPCYRHENSLQGTARKGQIKKLNTILSMSLPTVPTVSQGNRSRYVSRWNLSHLIMCVLLRRPWSSSLISRWTPSVPVFLCVFHIEPRHIVEYTNFILKIVQSNFLHHMALAYKLKNCVCLRPHGKSENFIIFNLSLIFFSSSIFSNRK